jgi:hypothetical protein
MKALLLLLPTLLHAQPYPAMLPIDHPAIRYNQSPLHDPVTRLKLENVRDLPTLLQALHINPDTQSLVFSKTSFQATKISPRNPRAIYFNDEVAVGYVKGSASMEVAALDPDMGYIFYTLEFPDGRPQFTRRETCLHCHQGPATLGVPGIFVGSVFPDSAGNARAQNAIITDHRTPFADRWGGWYIDAAHGHQRDRSNAVSQDPAEPEALSALPKFPSTSDIVALMVFEHQTRMTNLLTRLNWLARLNDPAIDTAINDTVDYLLFRDEAPLKEPIEGVSTFTKTFPQRGPLRDFDLQTRLFKRPLSYMIYSPSFDALPAGLRTRIYRRLHDALDPATLKILRETKPNLPSWW